MSFEEKQAQLPQALIQGVADYIKRHYQVPVMAMPCAMDMVEAAEMPERRSQKRRVCEDKALMPCGGAPATIERMLRELDAGFSETLLKLIDQKGKKDSEVYKKANLSKQHFSKIRNNPNYRPTKPTAIALALALELDLEQTKDLIGRAGYALSNSSIFDLVIRYFIEEKNYDVVQINIMLYRYDQPLLGS